MIFPNLARVAAWGLAAAIIVLSFVPPGLRPETRTPHFLEHISIYVVLGAALAIGYNKKRGVLAIFFVIFAGAIEVGQLFVPGRHARWSDFAFDALGMYLGLLAVTLARRVPTIRISVSRTGS